LIETFDVLEQLITGLIDRTIEAGGIPFVDTKNTQIQLG
jgi:hypothetical protein